VLGLAFSALSWSFQRSRAKGEYRCPACGELLEKFGSALIAYRLTIQPSIKDIRD
jgi:hypothetical protein